MFERFVVFFFFSYQFCYLHTNTLNNSKTKEVTDCLASIAFCISKPPLVFYKKTTIKRKTPDGGNRRKKKLVALTTESVLSING